MIEKRLFEMSDPTYADFQHKLTPTVDRELIIGVRVPVLRQFAKEIAGSPEANEFLGKLPHRYYDEDMLHGLLLSELKDYTSCVSMVNEFLPYVDNWAVCDIMSPRCFKKQKVDLLGWIKRWVSSPHTYTCRFGIEMLMSHYLDGSFKPDYLNIVSGIQSDEYYINMMISWYLATALAKHWDETIRVIEGNMLPVWVHNKAIQKAIESRRITDEKKAHLRSLKR